VEIQIDVGDMLLPATLDLPAGPARGGVAVLHGAEAGHRSFFCYLHLARTLPAVGVAVLRYDRRPHVDNEDVPLDRQAGDAAAAIAALRGQVGDVPLGLWGLSQGAWAAPLTAARHPERVSFLILVSSCGVSPAQQMRFGTVQQLRRHGFDEADVAELNELRAAAEDYLRGNADRAVAQLVVDRYADREWFSLSYVPRRLPDKPGSWPDMDFDPVPVFAQVSCPVLLFYGGSDAWMPIDDSIAAWRRARTGAAAELTIERLAGCDHLPTLNESQNMADISPQYTRTLRRWIGTHLPPAGPGGTARSGSGHARSPIGDEH
jgi:pimeloyl-ACP methyl ester carboxylesterase